MLLLPLSVIMGCLGYIFKNNPPTERNRWYGFRTKKSMANDTNWKKAQLRFGDYSIKYLWLTLLFGIIGLVIEMVGIVRSNDSIILSGIGLEFIMMLWYLFIVYWKVEKEL